MNPLRRPLIIALLAAACGGENAGPNNIPEGLDATLFAGTVSEPVGGSAPASASGTISTNLAGSVPLAWISAPPGLAPDGLTASILNQASGSTIVVSVVNGGFDPVPIPAAQGDTLVVAIALEGGGTAAARATVPARRRPRVVRTSPAKGRIDVAINASIVVIFSEPIADSSAAATKIKLFQGGTVVTGTVTRVAGSPLMVQFSPDALLSPGTPYQLVLDETIVDLAGDPLDGLRIIDFSTSLTAPSGPSGPATPITFTSSVPALDFGLAPGGGELAVRFAASRPAAPGEFRGVVTLEAGFSVAQDTCADGWTTAGSDCEVRVRFTPSGYPRDYAATLYLADDFGVRTWLPLAGTSKASPLPLPDLYVEPALLDAAVMVGLVGDPVTVTVYNTSNGDSPLATRLFDCTVWYDWGCAPVALEGSPLQVTGDSCDGQTLEPGASCTLRVAFAPKWRGSFSGLLVFDQDEIRYEPWGFDPVVHTVSFDIYGTGTGLVAGSAPHYFPPVSVGSSVTGTTVVSNLGDHPTGTIVVELEPGPFSLIPGADECTGRQLGVSESCSVSFRFSPTVPGTHSTVLWFRTSPGGPISVSVVGSAQ